MLNFEEDVFSSLNAASDALSSGQNIARLVKGYHFTGGGQGLFDGSEHVSLLKGDGGMFGLVQRSFDQWNGANGDFESCNYGLFISSSRGEQTKAFMTRGPNRVVPPKTTPVAPFAIAVTAMEMGYRGTMLIMGPPVGRLSW